MQNQDAANAQSMLDGSTPAYQYNSLMRNVNIDNALAAILDKFDTAYIDDIIKNSIANKFRPYGEALPNLVYGYDQQFAQLSAGFTSNEDDIAVTRRTTYVNIINTLCKSYNLQFNDYEGMDYYSAAFYLYEFLVSKFTDNLKIFFTNYLIQERESIYKSLNLSQFKKNDVYMAYSNKLFKDEKLSLIHGNIGYVISNMQTFDIELYDILDMVYANKSISRYIYNIVTDVGNFYKDFYVQYIIDSDISPELQTSIKLALQTAAGNIEDPNSIIDNK